MAIPTSLLADLEPGMIAVLGLPSDENSSFQRGAAEAPFRIREILRSGATNWCTESGLDLGTEPSLIDLGDLDLGVGATAFLQIEEAVGKLLARGVKLLCLGGDHAITFPIIKAFAQQYDQLNILQIDAHPDLYDEFEGNRQSHACAFARIMEARLATRLVQVGIRAATLHQLEQAERYGVEMNSMADWRPDLPLSFTGPLYLSLDMDALDPAFAPGVSHPEAGGLSTRDVIALIRRLKAPLVGADIVECNPERDEAGVTVAAAAKFLKEIAGLMIQQD